MANIKFSEFTEATAIGNIAFIVGYDGSTNKRILATDLLGDYLPLAGGTMTGDTLHGDNVKSRYNGMQIFNDGTDSFLYCLTGNLEFRNFESGKDITFFANYNNSLKEFMRIDGGANRIIVSEDMNFNSGDKLILNDNLRIYSSGNNSFISELDPSGILSIQAGADLKLQTSGGEDYIICNENSSVELYYDNAKKLETTSAGANITDTLSILGDSLNPGFLKLYAPNSANYVGVKGPVNSGTDYTLRLPNALPSVANQILESDASGTLSWIATPGVTTFLDLTDTPATYNCQNGKNVKVGSIGQGGQPADLIFTPDYFDFACSDEDTDLAIGTVFTMICNRAYSYASAVEFSVTTAPTGSTLIFDVRKNGTTVYTTTPSIDAGEKLTATATTQQLITGFNFSLAIGDELQVRITQVGSTVAGKGLKATMVYNDRICT